MLILERVKTKKSALFWLFCLFISVFLFFLINLILTTTAPNKIDNEYLETIDILSKEIVYQQKPFKGLSNQNNIYKVYTKKGEYRSNNSIYYSLKENQTCTVQIQKDTKPKMITKIIECKDITNLTK